MYHLRVATLGLGLVFALPNFAAAQQEIEFSGTSWLVRGQEAKLENYLGEEALLFRNSAAYINDLEFENGTIEFDLATAGNRSFVGVAFRIQESPGDYENFYVRPHNSGRFDAMQYTPVYNEVSAWQLYAEYNAALDIPRDQWVHVRLVISGSRLAVYFDDAPEPAMVVEEMKGRPGPGGVAIRAFFPANEPVGFYPTAYANFVVRPDDSPAEYIADSPPAPESGFISHWDISPAFEAPERILEELPAEMLEAEGWTTAIAESSGRVNLARYRGIPEGADRGTILARVVISSATEQVKKLNFGFSDIASVFLNGDPLFTGNNSYLSRSQRYLGVMTVDNDALYLPLKQGDNELVFAVSEAFGGWGIIARLNDLNGISVTAPSP